MRSKVYFYGHGGVYQFIKEYIDENACEVMGFIDSNADTQNRQKFEEKNIYAPSEIVDLEYDIIVLATELYAEEMKEALKTYSVPDQKIVACTYDLSTIRDKRIFDLEKVIVDMHRNNNVVSSKISEIASALRFQIGIKGINWLDEMSFTSGGAAVSYDYLYVMIKVLQHLRPKNILEFGLGQTSKVLSRYHDFYEGGYQVVEQDAQWKEFFLIELNPKRAFDVHVIPMVHIVDEEFGIEVNRYENIDYVMKDNKFDFFSIDGPFGSARNSRVDVLKYLPECLSESWCIMLDDLNRIGEQDMIRKLKKILDETGIEYVDRIYGEDKPFCLITSKNNKFLTTLF